MNNTRFVTIDGREELLADVDGTVPGLGFSSLSGSERARVVLELAIELARFEANQRPTMLLVDCMGGFDQKHFEDYLALIASEQRGFQAVLTATMGNIDLARLGIDGWVQNVTNQVLSYVPQIMCIVTGVDSSGAHIYTVDGRGELTCHDAAGFAAIGSGSRHAQSVMMFAGHTARNGFGDALFLSYAAKRESEVSPGVGAGTDMFVIPNLGGYTDLSPEALEPLDRFYNQMRTAQREARDQATAAMNDFLDEQMRRGAGEPPTQEGDDTPAPPETDAAALPAIGEAAPVAPPPAPEGNGEVAG